MVPFQHAKVPQWTSTLVENILKELAGAAFLLRSALFSAGVSVADVKISAWGSHPRAVLWSFRCGGAGWLPAPRSCAAFLFVCFFVFFPRHISRHITAHNPVFAFLGKVAKADGT